MATNIVQDLRVQPLKVKINTTGLVAANGFWITPGTPMKITGDDTMGIAGTGDAIDAYAQIAMNTEQYPTLADIARFRLPVISKYNYLISEVAGEQLTAGDKVGLMGASGVMKLAALAIGGAGGAPAGSTFTGGNLPVESAGKVLTGGLATKTVQILV